MEVKTVRQSGMPVELDQLKNCDEEFKKEFDIINAAHGQDMERVHKELELLDVKLAAKYDTISVFKLPETEEQIKNFIETYGNYMIALHKDTDEVLMVIIDQGI